MRLTGQTSGELCLGVLTRPGEVFMVRRRREAGPPPPLKCVSVEYKGVSFFAFRKCMKTGNLYDEFAACVGKDEGYGPIGTRGFSSGDLKEQRRGWPGPGANEKALFALNRAFHFQT